QELDVREERADQVGRQIGERGDARARHEQTVPAEERPVIEEADREGVLEAEVARGFSAHDTTERADRRRAFRARRRQASYDDLTSVCRSRRADPRSPAWGPTARATILPSRPMSTTVGVPVTR